MINQYLVLKPLHVVPYERLGSLDGVQLTAPVIHLEDVPDKSLEFVFVETVDTLDLVGKQCLVKLNGVLLEFAMQI